MISYNYTTKTITVGVTTQLVAVYTDSQNTFAQSAQMNQLMPLQANTPTLFTLLNGWTFSSGSIQYLSSAALQDSAGANVWCNVQTLGTIAAGTTLYISQGGAVTYTAPAAGQINMLLPIVVAGVSVAGGVATVYARLFQQTYSQFTFTGSASVQNVPLATAADPNLTDTATAIQAMADITATWGSFTFNAGDGQGSQPYSVKIVTTNPNRRLADIYNWVQYQMLQATNIDAGGSPSEIGNVTNPLVTMAGSVIFTQAGVVIEGFSALDANNIQYTDSNNVIHIPPPTITVTVNVDPTIVGGQLAVLQLSAAYSPATYTPASVVGTILNQTIAATATSLSMIFTANLPVVVRVRKPGYIPFELGTTVTNAGLSVTSQNPADTVYDT